MEPCLKMKECPFLECLLTKSKRSRKIGKNKVVLRATKSLGQYSSHAFFIALIPGDRYQKSNIFIKIP